MNYYLIAIILFLFIMVVLLYRSYYQTSIEPFIAGPCPNCGKRNKLQCFECNTCGWCLTPNGYGECVPGDSKGPYFRQDCLAWQSGPPPITYNHPLISYRQPMITAYRRPRWWRRRGW